MSCDKISEITFVKSIFDLLKTPRRAIDENPEECPTATIVNDGKPSEAIEIKQLQPANSEDSNLYKGAKSRQ